MSSVRTDERRAQIRARTLRDDRWWLPPLLTVAGLGLFLLYATVRIFWDQHYWVDEFHYLAPFYSPCLSKSCVEGSSHFLGQPLPEVPWLLSPAMFILVFPAASAPPATTTARLTTDRSGSRRRPAQLPSRTGPTRARRASRSSSRTSIGNFFYAASWSLGPHLRRVPRLPMERTAGSASGSGQ
jgi:hypothetical protein